MTETDKPRRLLDEVIEERNEADVFTPRKTLSEAHRWMIEQQRRIEDGRRSRERRARG